MQLQLNARTVFTILFCLVFAFLSAHILGVISTFYFDHDYVRGLVPMFNLDREGNAPAWFSGVLLMLSGLFLTLIAMAHRQRSEAWGLWLLLGVVFVFLSLDELVVFHEYLGYAVGDAVDAEGLLREYAWVLPYGVLVMVLGVLYLRFLLRIPLFPRKLIVLGGFLYVFGAIGIELAGSGLWQNNQADLTWQYYALVAVEETLEMLGVVIFLYALMLYCGMKQFSFGFRDLSV